MGAPGLTAEAATSVRRVKRVLHLCALVALVCAACQSGAVELVGVENPTVDVVGNTAAPSDLIEVAPAEAADAAPEADDVAPEADPEGASTKAEAAARSAGAESAGQTETAPVESPDEPTPSPTPVPTEVPTDEPLSDETADDDKALDDVDSGILQVVDSDDWCVAAEKIAANYQTVGTVDPFNPGLVEAVYTESYESLKTASAIAPPEIAESMELQLWTWEQVVQLVASAEWEMSAVPAERIVELGENNIDAFVVTNTYRDNTCN